MADVERLREVVSTYEDGITVAYLCSKHRMDKPYIEAAAAKLEAEGWLTRSGNTLIPVRPARKWLMRAWR